MSQPYGQQPYYNNQPGYGGGYGQPYPNAGYGQLQTVYVEEHRRRSGGGGGGLCAALLAGLCCGCCMESCCDDCCCCGVDC